MRRSQGHLGLSRVLLLLVVALSSLHCGDDGVPSGCSCLDRPSGDDDDSGSSIVPDDDDSAVADDDDDSAIDDDDSSGDDDSAVVIDITEFLPPCQGGVTTAFTNDELSPPGPDSDGYLRTSPDTLAAVANSLQALLDGDYQIALGLAALVDFELCSGEGAEYGTALWRARPLNGGVTTGRTLFAWRSLDARPLIVGVPHPWFETNTLEQGVQAFHELQARALIVSGTHRCANSSESPCSGTTGVCGGDPGAQAYRESDMAHMDATVYQRIHEVLSEHYSEDWVISLHGMSDDGISISNGTLEDSLADSPEALLGTALAAAFPAEPVTSCNDWPGATVYTRLCGTTNTQGRYLNSSADPCGEEATLSSGRFIHLEQSALIRQQPQTVLDAIDSVLP
jgi:hypothetical protein